MRRGINACDIQAIAKTGFGSLDSARYLLLRVNDRDAARRWLHMLAPTSIAGLKEHPAEICQIAFSATGLLALGVAKSTVCRFAPEFVEGIAHSESRSRRLGDTGENAPANWRWGVGDKEPHVLLMLFSSAAKIETLADFMLSEALNAGLSEIDVLSDSDMGEVEPFGFRD
jgi:hypothetical protein